MKSNAELLKLYTEEKDLVIGTKESRTGLEEFPSFGEWKQEYVREYDETHQTVDVKEADAMFDREVEMVEDELVNLVTELATENETNPDEDDDMTNEATNTVDNETPTAPATPKAQKPAKKGSKTPKAAKPAVKKEPSKADAARKVFSQMYPKVLEGKKARKDVIAAFVEKAGLTQAGASTYYQKMKKSHTAD